MLLAAELLVIVGRSVVPEISGGLEILLLGCKVK
jgi:hypothetical protein